MVYFGSVSYCYDDNSCSGGRESMGHFNCLGTKGMYCDMYIIDKSLLFIILTELHTFSHNLNIAINMDGGGDI